MIQFDSDNPQEVADIYDNGYVEIELHSEENSSILFEDMETGKSFKLYIKLLNDDNNQSDGERSSDHQRSDGWDNLSDN